MEINDEKMLRKKGVYGMLGISRHTLDRIIKSDHTFPRFIELSPGIKMIRARDIRAWLTLKELEARERSINAQINTN